MAVCIFARNSTQEKCKGCQCVYVLYAFAMNPRCNDIHCSPVLSLMKSIKMLLLPDSERTAQQSSSAQVLYMPEIHGALTKGKIYYEQNSLPVTVKKLVSN